MPVAPKEEDTYDGDFLVRDTLQYGKFYMPVKSRIANSGYWNSNPSYLGGSYIDSIVAIEYSYVRHLPNGKFLYKKCV